MFKFLKTRTFIIMVVAIVCIFGMGYEMDVGRGGLALSFGIVAGLLTIASFFSALAEI